MQWEREREREREYPPVASLAATVWVVRGMTLRKVEQALEEGQRGLVVVVAMAVVVVLTRGTWTPTTQPTYRPTC